MAVGLIKKNRNLFAVKNARRAHDREHSNLKDSPQHRRIYEKKKAT